MLNRCRLLLTLDLLANSLIIGAPLWVFFLPSPLLFSLMGRDNFLYPMMAITRRHFRWTLPCTALSLLLTLGTSAAKSSSPAATVAAAAALAAALSNAMVVVPRALQAGKPAIGRKGVVEGDRGKASIQAVDYAFQWMAGRS
mmetsp:Transcript_17741/g.45061  ORF Transcript_17741/g.45061 Transcript_17741/m.45061 type:complete len:142 (-) Transcript_17741:201-626(-)